MRRSRRFVVVSLAPLALTGPRRVTAAPAPTSPSATLPAAVRERAAALRDGALAGTRALEIVRSLTHEVGPRSAGSPGDKAAVAWGLRTLVQLGFENVHAD